MGTLKCAHEVSWRPEDYPNLPSAWYESPSTIAEIACMIAKIKNQSFVQLPFDTSLEAECLGTPIKWRDHSIHGLLIENKTGNEFRTIEDLHPWLEQRILSSQQEPVKRYIATKEAISKLKLEGHKVVFNLTGPITVLSALMGFESLLRHYIRCPQLVESLVNSLDLFYDDILQEVKEAGADLISYADPLGNKEVLGRRYFEKWSCPVQLKQIEKMKPCGVSIHVCGNLSSSMAELGQFPYSQENPLSFGSGISNGKVTGLSCIHSLK